MSIFNCFFDTFWGHVYRIDRLAFRGTLPGMFNGFVLTPGRYVGAEDVEDDGEPFEEKIGRLTRKLAEQFVEGEILTKAISKNLKGLGYDQ